MAKKEADNLTYRVDYDAHLIQFLGADIGTIREPKVYKTPVAHQIFVRERLAVLIR